MRKLKSLYLVGAVFSLGAMNGNCQQFPGGNICTTIAVPSVALDIIDEEGQTLPQASILISVDGGQPFLTECQGNCSGFVPLFEVTGRIDMLIGAFGKLSAMRSVQVPIDAAGCHPVTQNLTVILATDDTVAALAGVWETDNLFGRTMLRFGDQGEIIGAILFQRTIGGDGNFYISYNNHQIRGVPGQQVFAATAVEPTRNGDVFDFETMTLGNPVGFSNATMSEGSLMLSGTLLGQPVTYTRVADADVPDALRDPL